MPATSASTPETLTPPVGNALQLVLSTGAFAVCFAVFGSMAAMMPVLREELGLSELQRWTALALPVLLGSLARIPLGMLTDRFGGRRVFIATMVLSIIPGVLLGWVSSYAMLLVCGFFAGVGLASFSVGVGFTSRWYPPQRQGTALGIYGAGNIGQSLPNFAAPLVLAYLGFRWGFWGVGIVATIWLILFVLLARDAPVQGPRRSLRELLAPLRERMSWVLSLFYFVTFGGFVAMAISLPSFLADLFDLSPQDANLRTAGFVVLATALRPLGGWLADRFSGKTVLLWVFPATAVCGVFMACPHIATFTVGALGMAGAIGLGNGAVFKLVPQHFPAAVGSVTGLVGAAGGLGGFFPPLTIGLIRELTGSYAPGFVLLAVAAVACLLLLWRMNPREASPSPATANA